MYIETTACRIQTHLRRVFEQIAEFVFAAALGDEFGLHLGHFLSIGHTIKNGGGRVEWVGGEETG